MFMQALLICIIKLHQALLLFEQVMRYHHFFHSNLSFAVLTQSCSASTLFKNETQKQDLRQREFYAWG